MAEKKRYHEPVKVIRHLGGNHFASRLTARHALLRCNHGNAPVAELERDAKLGTLQADFQPSTMEGMVPQTNDYIFPVFRALSKTVIEFQWLDLTRGDVLKNSVPLLQGATVYPDHDWRVAGWLGVVDQTEWNDGQGAPGETGFVPPGIDAVWKLDWRVNPKIARGLVMTPPALHSSSVTFVFTMEKSHPDMNDFQFWINLGRQVDGQLVRMIVTEILSYWEHSLVFQGADVFAKSKGTREMKRFQDAMAKHFEPEPAIPIPAVPASLDANEEIIPPPAEGGEEIPAEGADSPSSVDDAADTSGAVNGDTAPDSQSNETSEGGETMLSKSLLEKLGFIGEDIDSQAVESAVAALLGKAEMAAIGEAYLSAIRSEAIRLVSIVEGINGKVDGSLIQTLRSADMKTAEMFVRLYRSKAEKKLQPKCQECGSTNVHRRSSLEESVGGETPIDPSTLLKFKL